MIFFWLSVRTEDAAARRHPDEGLLFVQELRTRLIVVDTDRVAPKERFSYWLETIDANFFPIEGERIATGDEPFFGRIEAKSIGRVKATCNHAAPFRLRRTGRCIARRHTGALVLGLPKGKPIVRQSDGRDILESVCGDAVICDSDRAYEVWADGPIRNESLHLPRELLSPYLGDVTGRPTILMKKGNGLTELVRATADAFTKLEGEPDYVTEGATQVLVHLLAVACGLHPRADTTITHSIAAARLTQAARFISDNAHNPALNAPAVASHLGISVRRLHALYETTGGSVARQIRTARMNRARQLLRLRVDRSILEVAFACGFYSSSTFYRCFSETFGVTPGEFRKDPDRLA